MTVYYALLLFAISAIDGAFHNQVIIPSSRRLCSADGYNPPVGFFLVRAQAAANEQDVEEALLRAQSALAADVGDESTETQDPGEDEIDNIANLLLEEPPAPRPMPPKEDPPLESLVLPTPPESVPPEAANEFRDILMSTASEKIGEQSDLIEERDTVISQLREEIEELREGFDEEKKQIGRRFESEKNELQMQIKAAEEEARRIANLSSQSTEEIKSESTRVESALRSRADGLISDIQRKDAEMERVRSEIKQIKTEKRAEISKLIKKSNVEKSYLKQINADLQRRVDDAEVKARDLRVELKEASKAASRLESEQSAAAEEWQRRVSDAEARLGEAVSSEKEGAQEVNRLRWLLGEERKKQSSLHADIAAKGEALRLYESDSQSFRKSLRITLRVARRKIGDGVRRPFRRFRGSK